MLSLQEESAGVVARAVVELSPYTRHRVPAGEDGGGGEAGRFESLLSEAFNG